jgi:hypothetical protein
MSPNVDEMPVPNSNAPGSQTQNMPAYAESGRSMTSGMISPQQNLNSLGDRSSQGGPGLPEPLKMSSQGQNLTHFAQGGTGTNKTRADDENASIEEECIARAKLVVQETSGDPYLQVKEISKVKADLLNRRYGKVLKISEG